MYSKILVASLISSSLFVSGCTTTGEIDKHSTGAGLGALTGALLAYGLGKGHSDKEVAIAFGTFVGAIIGGGIGAKLTEADRVIAGRNLGDSLENDRSGSSRVWNNPDSGNSGTTTPVRTIARADGTPCREFTTTVLIGGSEEEAYGTACRQADGSWKVMQ
ncbi:MAG: surface antigen [Parasphingorhabdus sp.]|jgi:surface antigen